MKTFVLLTALCATAFADQSLECMACNDAVALLDYALDSPFSEGSLKTLLKEACEKLPSQYAAGCAETSAELLDMIVKDIEGFTGVLCQKTLNCAPVANQALKTRSQNLSENLVCEVFDKVYAMLPSLVEDFKSICTHLPTSAQQTSCTDFFTQHKDLVVQMADDIFTKLVAEIPFVHCKLQPNVSQLDSSSLECMACNDGVALLDYVIDAPFTKGSLESLLNGECAKLPPQYSAGCAETVNKTLDMIVTDAIGFANEICPKALNCPAPSQLAEFNAQSVDSLCAMAEIFYQQIPDDVSEFANICTKLSGTAARVCKGVFANEQPEVAAFAQRIFKELIARVPFVDCQLTA